MSKSNKKSIYNYILCILYNYVFQITDFPAEYLSCTKVDQTLLSLFKVDTGRYEKLQYGYRKRTGPYKVIVPTPLVEERINLLV